MDEGQGGCVRRVEGSTRVPGRSGSRVRPLCAREGGYGAGCAHLGVDHGHPATSSELEEVESSRH